MTGTLIDQDLSELNLQIGAAESRGTPEAKAWLDQIIAPSLAFRRANGKFAGREEYLEAVAPSDPRETTIEGIEIYGERAVVRCVVSMQTPGGTKRFHNLRLFVREGGAWKLLGWANEAI